MAKKKFEQEPYNPLSEELVRDASIMRKRQGSSRRRTNEDVSREQLARNVIDLQPRPQVSEDPAPEVAEEPLARAPEHIQPSLQATRARSVEPSGPMKRYKVTTEEDHELGKFVLQLREASNTKVSLGLLNRVTNTLLIDAVPEILAEIKNAPPPSQPPNNDAVLYAEFEEAWARIIERALRRRRNPR